MKTRKQPKTVWLIWASISSIILIGVYLSLHIFIKGQEDLYLNPDQLETINSIITAEKSSIAYNTLNDSIHKAKIKDLELQLIALKNNPKDSIMVTDSIWKYEHFNKRSTEKLVIHYLENILPESEDSTVWNLVATYKIKHLITILPTYSFKVSSFFWLSGAKIFLEIVFWSLFGLMANLMFSVTKATKFDKKRIPEHIGKIFYTPFSAIIIYLSINGLINEGAIVIDGVGKSVIVLAFILGFFTRRTILLLGKVKDLILPTGKDDIEPTTLEINEIKGTVIIDQVSDDIKAQHNEYIAIRITGVESDYVSVINSDKNGVFSFINVPNGNYSIEADLVIDETRYYAENQIQILENEPPLDVIITIKKADLIIK